MEAIIAENEIWKIEDDGAAEWTLEKIRENNAEYARLIAVCRERVDFYTSRIEEYQNKAAKENSFFEGKLREYFGTVPHRATKTQEVYALPSGTLRMKTPPAKWEHDDEKLMALFPAFVERKPSLRWAELKKRLAGTDMGVVIDTQTGEVVDGVTLVAQDPVFAVEV